MSNDNKELQKLISINKDASEFYEEAQEKAKSPSMKSTFRELEVLHNGVISSLQGQVRANGGEVEADETIMGQMREFYGEISAMLSSDPDYTLVKHLEEAEDRCLHSMQDAIDSDDISAKTKAVLEGEINTLQRSHDYMKALKDDMARNDNMREEDIREAA